MENTGISWCHHTVNPWWGCEKVSPACAFCYAEGVDHRFTKKDGGKPHWGANAPRRIRVEAASREAFRYEKRAVAEGRRFRVFCASMADFFEDRRDLDLPRLQFLDVIRRTPHLDWLILTKRPEAIRPLLERAFLSAASSSSPLGVAKELREWLWSWAECGEPPANVALGTTAETQEWADRRLIPLLQVPARTHFVSVEPMLGPVDLRCVSPYHNPGGGRLGLDALAPDAARLDWVICGGESGRHARHMDLQWVRDLLASCRAADVPFFMKQLSEADAPSTYDDFDSFLTYLQVRQFPAAFDYP